MYEKFTCYIFASNLIYKLGKTDLKIHPDGEVNFLLNELKDVK